MRVACSAIERSRLDRRRRPACSGGRRGRGGGYIFRVSDFRVRVPRAADRLPGRPRRGAWPRLELQGHAQVSLERE